MFHRSHAGHRAGSRHAGLGNACIASISAPYCRSRGRAVRVRAAAEVEEQTLSDEKRDIQKLLSRPYKYGFQTLIESNTFPKGLSEDVVRAISAKKGEPEWMLEFRLRSYR